ncbi:hypothetical protein B0H11DRAFT_1928597 [Mycena galericulata]|nr:hypothetical protein B0H11DRAFT_1928597 [Mycena galericulata]
MALKGRTHVRGSERKGSGDTQRRSWMSFRSTSQRNRCRSQQSQEGTLEAMRILRQLAGLLTWHLAQRRITIVPSTETLGVPTSRSSRTACRGTQQAAARERNQFCKTSVAPNGTPASCLAAGECGSVECHPAAGELNTSAGAGSSGTQKRSRTSSDSTSERSRYWRRQTRMRVRMRMKSIAQARTRTQRGVADKSSAAAHRCRRRPDVLDIDAVVFSIEFQPERLAQVGQVDDEVEGRGCSE